jgi:hypothetical protein
MGSFAQTVSVAPMAPDSATTVQVLANSYYGIEGESHVVFGDLIRVFFDEGTADLAPNPSFPPKIATIGTLPPGVYTIEITVTQDALPPKKFTQTMAVTEAVGEYIKSVSVLPNPPLSGQVLTFAAHGLNGCGNQYAVNSWAGTAWSDFAPGTEIRATYIVTQTPNQTCFGTPPPFGVTGMIGPLPPGQYTLIARGSVFGVQQPALRIVFTLPASPVAAVEFYRAGVDHYFLTADPLEMSRLDFGYTWGWVRTGETFGVAPAFKGTGAAVCRFYGLPAAGLDSHFYSASPAECDAVKQRFPGAWVFESSDVFGAGLPDTSDGSCPPGLRPLYRLYNNRGDSNHRYTTSESMRSQMIAKGWVPEGYGQTAVAMCVY